MYVILFCLRYIDLFMYFVSFYNTLMKVAFISLTLYTLYLMRWKKPYCIVSGLPPPRHTAKSWTTSNTSSTCCRLRAF